LLAITNDILDLSKIDAGKLELDMEAFDPALVVKETVALFAPRASSAGLVLESHMSEDVPHDLLGDAGRLRQVLSNLVGNAVKFTMAGWIRIETVVETREDAAVLLAFTVSDSGIGMNAEQQEKLFRPYSQAEQSINRRFGGTGLGLAICLQLVELMGGSFDVTSEPGQGSRFTFRIRFAVCEAGSACAKPAARVLLDQRFSGRVLLVEDNFVNRRVAHATLRALGVEVIEAENGQVAVDALSHLQVDLILMDMNMPVMDGLEATRRIRMAEAAGELAGRRPIVAMTANVLREAIDACQEAGMDGFVPKPFQRSQLIDALAQWLPLSGAATVSLLSTVATEPMAEDAIDVATYRALAEAMGSEMRPLIGEFIASTEQLLDDIAGAARLGDAVAIKSAAHSLKSSSATMGAATLSALAAALESGATAQNCRDAEIALRAEFSRVRDTIVNLSNTIAVNS
jgi:CheY-like chemotaxis protein/HPt (histidine-containing phosphotransfer) domain-containing protein